MKKVCFDFDGVLVRSRYEDKTFLWSQAIEADLGISAALRAELFAPPHWQEIVVGKKPFQERLVQLFAEFAYERPVKDFIDYWLDRDLNWYEPALALARDLKASGVDLYVTSNQDRLRTQRIRDLPEIKELFTAVITSSELGVAKPDPDFFRGASRAIAGSDRIILIDDDARNVAAAVEAGWTGFYFNPDLEPKTSFADLKLRVSTACIQ